MPTAEERRAQAQLERDNLIAQNRAKFTKNRVAYVTPSGIHMAHDIDDLPGLIDQLKEAGFSARETYGTAVCNTTDWFKHGEGDWWESYVISEK